MLVTALSTALFLFQKAQSRAPYQRSLGTVRVLTTRAEQLLIINMSGYNMGQTTWSVVMSNQPAGV